MQYQLLLELPQISNSLGGDALVVVGEPVGPRFSSTLIFGEIYNIKNQSWKIYFLEQVCSGFCGSSDNRSLDLKERFKVDREGYVDVNISLLLSQVGLMRTV